MAFRLVSTGTRRKFNATDPKAIEVLRENSDQNRLQGNRWNLTERDDSNRQPKIWDNEWENKLK